MAASCSLLFKLRRAAEEGDAQKQAELGHAYYFGLGLAQSYADAAKWFQLAAAQGHAQAQYNLGLCYEFGRGVPQSDTDAAK